MVVGGYAVTPFPGLGPYDGIVRRLSPIDRPRQLLMLGITSAYSGRTVRLFVVTVVLTPFVHTGHAGLQHSDADAGGVGGRADRGACWGTVVGDGAARGDGSGAGTRHGAAALDGTAAALVGRTVRHYVVTAELTQVVHSNLSFPRSGGDTFLASRAARGGYFAAGTGRGAAAGDRASRAGTGRGAYAGDGASRAGTGRGAAAAGDGASRGSTVLSGGRRSRTEKNTTQQNLKKHDHRQASPILWPNHAYLQ